MKTESNKTEHGQLGKALKTAGTDLLSVSNL